MGFISLTSTQLNIDQMVKIDHETTINFLEKDKKYSFNLSEHIYYLYLIYYILVRENASLFLVTEEDELKFPEIKIQFSYKDLDGSKHKSTAIGRIKAVDEIRSLPFNDGNKIGKFEILFT